MATSTADWIEELKGISVLELSERIKALEEEFGVSATAVAAAAPAAGGGGGDAGGEEASSTVDVILTKPNPILHYEWDTWYIMSKKWAEANNAVAPPVCQKTTVSPGRIFPVRIWSSRPASAFPV